MVTLQRFLSKVTPSIVHIDSLHWLFVTCCVTFKLFQFIQKGQHNLVPIHTNSCILFFISLSARRFCSLQPFSWNSEQLFRILLSWKTHNLPLMTSGASRFILYQYGVTVISFKATTGQVRVWRQLGMTEGNRNHPKQTWNFGGKWQRFPDGPIAALNLVLNSIKILGFESMWFVEAVEKPLWSRRSMDPGMR